MARDDFPQSVVTKLAERSGFFCSNPSCRRRTIGPDSTPDGSSSIGVAAHIHAAAPGGPRYDPQQTPEERRSINNGLWVCNNCSRMIDNDPGGYPAETLKRWRAEHEGALLGDLRDIAPPTVSLETLPMVLVRPGGPTTVTADDCARFRDHRVRVVGHHRYAFDRLSVRFQLPEVVVASWVAQRPSGREVQAFPEPTQFGADIGNVGAVIYVGDPNACNSYHLDIAGVRPGDRFEVILRSVRTPTLDSIVAGQPPDITMTYAEGTAEFIRDGIPAEVGFRLPFTHDRESRMVRSRSMQSDDAPLLRQRIRVWGDSED